MAHFVIDPSALVALVRDGRPIDPAHQLVAPNSLRSDALELLLNAVRDGQMPEDEALRLHEQMTATKVRLLGDRVSRRTAWRIARENSGATLHEAEYLAVTALQADALVTVDDALATKADGVVPVLGFDALFPRG
jgi:predicted nucleic acid-binding protein